MIENESIQAYRKRFDFDQVYGENTSTRKLYNKLCKKLVRGGMQGINGTIFAHGQVC